MKEVVKILSWMVAGAAILYLFTGNCNKKEPVKPKTTSVAQDVKEIKIAADTAKIKFDSAQKVIDKLNLSLKNERNLLKTAQQKARELESTVEMLSDQIPVTNEYDGADLKKEISHLVENSRERDSLCNSQSQIQDSVIAAQGAQIQSGQMYAYNLSKILDRAVDDKRQLENYSSQLRKQVKRKKVAAWVWKAAAIGAGIFIIKKS